ncbi:hypothetical protein EIP91_009738 [Steccherinum ochraceum]|uniref:Uncharacterized protein n=1 Tax=Steccherinum ochraceum TaxID=92696 RepID=A0A4R0R1B6_9APHY|nr:hypothetical protein EIP91_009738 [Steccherinum ochraceum]
MSPTIIVEKDGLLPSSLPLLHGRESKRSWLRLAAKLALVSTCTISAFWSLGCLDFPELSFLRGDDVSTVADLCPQPPALTPSVHAELWGNFGKDLEKEEFWQRAVDWLSGAVRIPTPSFDGMGPIDEDERWKAFVPFQEYLLKSYPQVHATLSLTKINTYGLVYEWTGSNAALKPLLLAAHQDVVPVNPDTVDEWTHPPFSGHYDGERLWGRGSSDDKNGLIGILSVIEILLEKDFKPTRSVVLAFGFDEETSGIYGAKSIADYLLEHYGENSFAMLVDEGGKSELNDSIVPKLNGGHSSVPPAHTTIGILSSLLTQVEKNPFKTHLGRGTPMYEKALCLAAHAPELPKKLQKALRRAPKSDKALRTAESILFEDRLFKSLVQTTQAIDLIQGGVKTNALPESAWAVVNHRIATDSSVSAVQEHDTEVLLSLAQEFNLSVTAFGKQLSEDGTPAYGKLVVSDAWGHSLAPAPITPTRDAAPFQLLAGTVKATYNAFRAVEDDGGVVVSPGHMSGNTDTRYYWQLTPHIFRYNHHFTGKTSLFKDIHTVNEFIDVDAFKEMLNFFTTLILNADESTAL